MSLETQPRDANGALPTFAAAGVLFIVLASVMATANAQQTSGRMAAASPSAMQPAQVPLPLQSAAADSSLETVGTGDLLRINVFRNPDLATEARVTDTGTIAFPLIGDVTVKGLTAQQVGTKISQKLRDGKFVVNPEVTVSLAQVNSRQVSVLGNVAKPGRYPIDAVNSKLTDFIAAAGGVAGTGSDSVTIVSMRDGQQVKTDVDLEQMFRQGNLAANMPLAAGDTIYVHRAPVVYVYGEVQKAGAYRLEPHMTVMQAIAMGGGLTIRGTERGVKIHRRDPTGNVRKMDVALTDPVQTDDVVFVRESLF